MSADHIPRQGWRMGLMRCGHRSSAAFGPTELSFETYGRAGPAAEGGAARRWGTTGISYHPTSGLGGSPVVAPCAIPKSQAASQVNRAGENAL